MGGGSEGYIDAVSPDEICTSLSRSVPESCPACESKNGVDDRAVLFVPLSARPPPRDHEEAIAICREMLAAYAPRRILEDYSTGNFTLSNLCFDLGLSLLLALVVIFLARFLVWVYSLAVASLSLSFPTTMSEPPGGVFGQFWRFLLFLQILLYYNNVS